MKKAIAGLASLLACMFLLTACETGGAAAALEIDEAKIDTELYAYYLNEAVAKPQAHPDLTAQEAAERMCREYVAVNTKFIEYDCALTMEQKVDVTERVNALWRLYEPYYTSIGVSKQTMTKIITNEASRESLLLRLYDTDGVEPAAESDIQQYFTQNYIVFRAINGYLTEMDEEGNILPLAEDKRAELLARFDQMTNRINGGEDIAAVNKEYLASQGAAAGSDTELAPLVVERTNPNYPDGFFEEVVAMDDTTAKAITLGNYVYIVKRINATAGDSSYYAENRTACLMALRADDFEAMLREEWASAYTVKEHAGAMKKCLRRIEEQRAGLSVTAPSTEGETMTTEALTQQESTTSVESETAAPEET